MKWRVVRVASESAFLQNDLAERSVFFHFMNLKHVLFYGLYLLQLMVLSTPMLSGGGEDMTSFYLSVYSMLIYCLNFTH